MSDTPGRSDGEASPLQSKKFVAYLVAELGWKALAALVLFWGRDAISHQVWAILLGIVVVAGFVEALYIGGQAAIDKYVRVARIAAGAGQVFKMKGIETGKAPEPPKDEENPEDNG